MEDTESHNSIPNIASFNADWLITELGIRAEQATEIAAIRFIFSQMLLEDGNQNKIDARKTAQLAALEKIRSRYGMFCEYSQDFFQKPFQAQALAIVVMCDEQVNEADGPRQNEDGEMLDNQNDGFDDGDLTYAARFWEEALCIQAYYPDIDDPFPESFFLAHLNIYHDMLLLCQTIEDYTIEQITEILEKDIATARKFIRMDTRLGQEVDYVLDETEGHINNILGRIPPPQPTTHTALTKSHLHLVPPEGAN